MIDLIKTVLLENTSGGHDKFYYIEISHNRSGYTVTRSWGRRPFAKGKGQGASETFTTYFAASMAFADRVMEKRHRGYSIAHEWESDAPSGTVPATSAGEEVFGF